MALQAPTILIPGAAGSAAIDAIRSLREVKYSGRIIATDGEPLAAGFRFSDAYYVTHSIDNPRALRQMRRVIEEENVKLILPTSFTDTAVYARIKAELAATGVVFAGCDGDVVDLCDDKLRFWHMVHKHFPVPANIGLDRGYPDEYPCFVKPRMGSGGRGSGICRDDDDWRMYRKRCESLIAQEVLPGAEYSVDVLCDLKGTPIVAIPRERISISDGVSTRARVIRDELLVQLCLSMAHYLNIKGVACMQLKRDSKGFPRFLEVNARLGGSTRICSLAGFDVVGALVALALGNEVCITEYREITVIRYFNEVVVD